MFQINFASVHVDALLRWNHPHGHQF